MVMGKFKKRLFHHSDVENDNAGGTYEKTQVKITDAYFQSSGFGRILDDHHGDGAEPHAEYENPRQRLAEKL